MKRVDIVCDASFDSDLHLTGYAGVVLIRGDDVTDDLPIEYNGCDASFDDSNKGEMVAVFYGLTRLKRYLQASGRAPTRINVYTDSESTIGLYRDFLNRPESINKLYLPFMERLQQEAESLPVPPTLRYVRSHVPDHLANQIEKIHNIQDARADNARKHALTHLFHPDIKNSSWCGVVLPVMMSETQEKLMRELATALASQNIKCRIAIEIPYQSPEEHPFISAIHDYAKSRNTNPNELYYIPHGRSATGFDRTLLNHHIFMCKDEDVRDSEHDRIQSSYSSHRNFTIASELIYGPLSTKPNHTGREHKASAKVFDLTRLDAPLHATKEPHSVSQWLDKLSDYVMIPHHFGFDAIMRFAKINKEEQPLRKRARQHTSLLETLNRYSGRGAPELLAERMTNVLIDFGAPNDDSYKEKMARFILLHPHREPGALIAAIERKSKTLIERAEKPKESSNVRYAKALADQSEKRNLEQAVDSDPLKAELEAVMLDYGPILEKHQLSELLADTIIKHGFPTQNWFKQSLLRNIMSSRPAMFRNPEDMAAHCIKQAHRFSHAVPAQLKNAQPSPSPERNEQTQRPIKPNRR